MFLHEGPRVVVRVVGNRAAPATILFPLSRHDEIHRSIASYNARVPIDQVIPSYVPHVTVLHLDRQHTLYARIDASVEGLTNILYIASAACGPLREIDEVEIRNRVAEQNYIPETMRSRLSAWRNKNDLLHYAVMQLK